MIQADDGSVVADVPMPADGRSRLDGDPRSHIRANNRVAIGRLLLVEPFQTRQARHVYLDPFTGEVLGGLQG